MARKFKSAQEAYKAIEEATTGKHLRRISTGVSRTYRRSDELISGEEVEDLEDAIEDKQEELDIELTPEQQMTKSFEEEIIPFFTVLAKMSEEHGDKMELVCSQLLKPFEAGFIRFAKQSYKLHAENILESVKTLEENGFTRDQAIALLGK